jgi:hypothetical protein
VPTDLSRSLRRSARSLLTVNDACVASCWREQAIFAGRLPPPCGAAPFAVAVVGRLVWRQLRPAVGAVARDGRGLVVRWPPPPCGAAPLAGAVVGRLVWRQLRAAVGAVAGGGRVLVLVLHSHVSVSCRWLRVETNESAGYRQVMAITTARSWPRAGGRRCRSWRRGWGRGHLDDDLVGDLVRSALRTRSTCSDSSAEIPSTPPRDSRTRPPLRPSGSWCTWCYKRQPGRD